MRVLLALLLGAAVTVASAQDSAQWKKEARQAYGRCAFTSTSALIVGPASAEDFAKSNECVDVALKKTAAGFRALPVEKSATASGALKDFYAAWIAAMKALPSLLAGSHAAADRSTTASIQRLDELWARYEIEVGSN